MAEYIERIEAINEVVIRSSFYDAEYGNKRFTPDDVKEILQSINAADVVERKKGKWVIDSDNIPICSNCGEPAFQRLKVSFKRCKNGRKKRKYYRKCGICGIRLEQSDMVRDDCSPNGWLCLHCHCNVYIDDEW